MYNLHKRFRINGWKARNGYSLTSILLLLLLPTGVRSQDLYCPDCHNASGIPVPHDAGCRDTTCAESCHAIDLSKLNHLSGPGTPVTGDRTTSCNTCHNAPFDGVYHPYRINVSPGTPTIPGEIDLDQACGQCHGGGAAQDPAHQPKPPALYRTKFTLAAVAQGMHASAGVTFPVTFTATATNLTANVIATVDCGGTCPPLTYDWNWGDGSQDLGSTAAASHSYAAAGTYSISLVVQLSGLSVGSTSRSVSVTAPDLPPVAAGTCTWEANSWTMTLQDASIDTDATGIQTVTVTWGDGSSNSIGGPGASFAHTYLNAGTYAVTLKAIDTALKASNPVYTCPIAAAASYFTIHGTVFKKDAITPVPSAVVTVKKGTAVVKTVYTAANGTFSAASLKPGTYTLTVRKPGYNFGVIPQAELTLGPDSNPAIVAVSP